MIAPFAPKNFTFNFNSSGILSALLLPFFSIICMNYTIGGNVTGMVLGIVNNEVGSISECFNTSLVTAKTDNYECILDRVSCRFINQINETVAIKVNEI